MQDLVASVLAVLLVSLRVAPMLAYAPPFTLLAIPPTIRVLLALGLALCLVAGRPQETSAQVIAGHSLVVLAAGELVIGMAIALALQLAFAALQWAGGDRTHPASRTKWNHYHRSAGRCSPRLYDKALV